jgi:hypothetical protein
MNWRLLKAIIKIVFFILIIFLVMSIPPLVAWIIPGMAGTMGIIELFLMGGIVFVVGLILLGKGL